ncbi:DUF4238 domain-containing protein [Leptospira sp. 96542]|nr:DUF4238 domain-containing protein [Leptospira sp. 96542]
MGQNQHTVPQIYLSSFTDFRSEFPDKPLKIFDKDKKLFFSRGTKNFLTLNHFYSFRNETGEKDNKIEKYLSALETKFAGAKKRLISEIENFSNISSKIYISEEDKIIFGQFLIWQYKRTISFMQNIEEGLAKEFEKDGLSIDKLPNGNYSYEMKNYVLFVLSKFGENSDMNFLEILLRKNLVISIIPDNISSGFITSDNPVLITNKNENTGIVFENTEISIPLTPKIALSFFQTGNSVIKNIQRNKLEIRKTNISIAKNAFRYVIGPSDYQLKRICKNL